MAQTILTGVKPTGAPQIGNYFAVIKPAIELAKSGEYDCFYFIADYHALNFITSAQELKQHTLEVASTWLACGVDPNKVYFYRQSDIPETFELTSILSNLTPKGLLNRAHAYKAKVDQNRQNNLDDDNDVNMGLFNYPLLMTADIALFNANKVPVGQDQKQHIEIARDIIKAFNKRYGKALVMPSELVNENAQSVPGLDGRKMSKSYSNVIPLFCSEEELKKLVSKIKTDSAGLNEPKGTDNLVFTYYSLFATPQQTEEFKQKLASGISWAEAKNMLFELMNSYLFEMREKYNYYINNPQEVENILKQGAQKARIIAKQTIERVRKAIGVE